MSKTQEFLNLKERWKIADGMERAQIEHEIHQLLQSMDEADNRELLQAVQTDFDNIQHDLTEVRKQAVRTQLEEILPAISISYIAKHYFGKSSSWFYQRLNGNKVNGHEVTFSPAERETLAHALQDLSNRLQTIGETI